MEIFNIYEHSEYRFVLGKLKDMESKTLIYLGLKPSSATNEQHDNTTSFLTNWASKHNYQNIVFLNIYPYVCTSAKELPQEFSEEIFNNNYAKINDILNKIKNVDYDVLCAWGDDISERDYLSNCKKEILNLFRTKYNKSEFKCFGITENMNPKQVRNIKSDANLISFNA